jgi:hypothetical protein
MGTEFKNMTRFSRAEARKNKDFLFFCTFSVLRDNCFSSFYNPVNTQGI